MNRGDPTAAPVPDPAALVADLSRAHIAARCLHVIAECGAADVIGDAGASPDEIAARTRFDADALDRMLRLLAAHGIFVRTADGRYTHSAASRLLKSDAPGSLRAYVLMAGMPAFWDKFTELGRTAREGQGRHDMTSLVEYYAAHPEEN